MNKKFVMLIIVIFYGCCKNKQNDINMESMDLKLDDHQYKIVSGKDSNKIFNINPNDPKLYQFLSTPATVKRGASLENNQYKIVSGKDSNNIFKINPNDPKLYQFLSAPATVRRGASN